MGISKKLFNLCIIGFIFVSVIGVINHFVYELSGESEITAIFCPINESTWEHLKLIFFPYIIWGAVQYFLMNKNKKVIPSKTVGVIVGMITTVLFFYTYTGISGKNISFLNILSFFIGVFSAFFVDYILIKSECFKTGKSNLIAIIILILICIIFFLFTYMPPLVPLFKDPIDESFGL
ncbi:MAG: DUF6512 family protein [Clostridiales bacterium]|nr:DUF6512 family protein [Clostridiales bacterium]